MTNTIHQQPSYHPHWSASTRSSASSNPRSSDNSIFSHIQNRVSTVSTDSSWSNISNLSRTQYLLQTERSLTGNSSPLSSHAPSPIEGPNPPSLRKRAAPRTPAPNKDHYKTCVSRKQRSRRSNAAQNYFCTCCEEPFAEKADWKRHEETYQERFEEFQCDLCYAKYFLDKDFVTHHIKAHGCASCYQSTKSSEKKHVQQSRKERNARTGWGCGFCYHFFTDWVERCNHIAYHFDHENKTMADWNHSIMIYSLLQRPDILREWGAILEIKNRMFIGFGWERQSTARVEGYPDSNNTLRLQDALEYFTSEQDAAALAQLAFDKAVTRVPRERAPPPVPPKDYPMNHKTSLQDISRETDEWKQFVDSIIDDDQFPTNVTYLEDDFLDDAAASWLDLSL
jgi:hypothetical protein